MDDLAFLESAYARTLGRAVDPHALREGLRALAAGDPREALVQRLADSDEALARAPASDTPAAASVERLMAIGPGRRFVEQALGAMDARPPEPARVDRELAELRRLGDRRAWLRALLAADPGRSRRIADSHRIELEDAEISGATRAGLDRMLVVGDLAFIHLAYWRVLGRAPDPGARRAWSRRLADGARREHLLHELIASGEGRTRSATLDGLGPAPSPASLASHRALSAVKGGWRKMVQRIGFHSSHH